MSLSPSIQTRLQYQHQSLTEITAGLSDIQLRKAVITGKWSVFENIVHLATYQQVFMSRVKQILETGTPSFGRYSADTDPLFHDNCSQPTAAILDNLVMTREEMIRTLSALTPGQLQRRGLHPLFGPMDIRQWLEFFLLHEAHHLFTIFKLAAELRKG